VIAIIKIIMQKNAATPSKTDGIDAMQCDKP